MNKKSKDVVITAALRTPIGIYKGSLKTLSAVKLGTFVIKEVLKKSKLKVDDIDEVIMGQVLTSGTGQNPARQAAIYSGIPISKPAYTINQVCGSGLRSVILAYQSIKLGENNIMFSGGQESMSRAPHALFFRENIPGHFAVCLMSWPSSTTKNLDISFLSPSPLLVLSLFGLDVDP